MLVHGGASHTHADAVAVGGAGAAVVAVANEGAMVVGATEDAVVVGANEGSDRPSLHVVDVVPRSNHPVGAVLDIRSRASPSRTAQPAVNPAPPMRTANHSWSDYETHGLGLVAPAVGLDAVKILMILKAAMLKVVVVVVFVVLVQSVRVTIFDDAVLKAVVEVDMMVRDDAVLKVVVVSEVIAIVRILGGGVKEESVKVVVVTNIGDVASAVDRAMQVVDGRIVAVVAHTTIRRRAYHHH